MVQTTTNKNLANLEIKKYLIQIDQTNSLLLTRLTVFCKNGNKPTAF